MKKWLLKDDQMSVHNRFFFYFVFLDEAFFKKCLGDICVLFVIICGSLTIIFVPPSVIPE